MDMAPASLVIPSPPLNRLLAYNTSQQALAVLPLFTSLQVCKLRPAATDSVDPLDLLPLQVLPGLQHLKLCQGDFCNLHAAACVTKLSISHALQIPSRNVCLL